jgi:hypothetical protein
VIRGDRGQPHVRKRGRAQVAAGHSVALTDVLDEPEVLGGRFAKRDAAGVTAAAGAGADVASFVNQVRS